jgi:hypothetical protein
MIGIPQGMQSAEQEEPGAQSRSRGGCKIPDTEVQDPAPPAFILFFSTTTQHNTHHTTQQRKEVEFGTANPKKLKKMGNNEEIINSQDLKSKPRFRS